MEARQLSLFKGRRQRGVKPPLALEYKTHIAIADALRWGCAPGWIWNHFPSGEKRDPQTGAKLKRMGHQPGWADFVLVAPTGTHFWLELKRGKAPLSEEQEAFGTAMRARGVPYRVVRSYDEAVGQLIAWGALRLRVSA